MQGFLVQATIFLGAAIICVPLMKRLGMSSVLGYLVAGILIGPFVFGFVGEEGEELMHFAEFGVVMMLFLIGLELDPTAFWKMRKMIAGMGGMQMGLSALIVGLAAFFLLGFTWQAALATGLALAMSSTAIVLQTLNEKGLMQTSAGQSSFAVLLFQDIAVIPILALLPLLATKAVTDAASHHPEGGHDPAGGHSIEAGHEATSFLANQPGWIQTLALIGAVAFIVIAGRYIVVPLLRQIAKANLREILTASALFIVVGIAALMQLVGLSPALGTFLAGVLLANSDFRYQLESDIEPFKGLLLGLFFISVGASIDFQLLADNPLRIAGLVAGVMLVKALVLYAVGRVFQLDLDQNILFFLGLSQIGEFAFVLLAFMGQLSILGPEWIGSLLGATAITMTISPILLLLNEKFVQPRFGTTEQPTGPADVIEQKCPVIIAGFGHFGSTVARFLRANNVNATILDNDSERVELLRRMGFQVYYGDATRMELLESAGVEDAKIFIIATDAPDTNYHFVETLQKHYPHLEIMVRARNRYDAYDLIDLGAQNIYRETLDTSIRMGVDVLKKMGFRAYTAQRQAQNFLKFDEEALYRLKDERHDKNRYITLARERIEWEERMMQEERRVNPCETDDAWDSEHMREDHYDRGREVEVKS